VHVPWPAQVVAGSQTVSTTPVPAASWKPGSQPQTKPAPFTVHWVWFAAAHGLGLHGVIAAQPPAPSSW
jgi:hypothetical protein